MLQRLGIRGKLLAVVAVPILVLVLAAGFITIGSVQDLNQARNAEALIDTLDRARTLEANLQEERYATATYLHVIQDTESRLDEAYDFSDAALDNIDARLQVLADQEVENLQQIRNQVNSAIGRQDVAYMIDERGVSLSPPTEESNGWAVFPAEDEITQMQSGYAEAVADIEALEESLPEDLGLGGPLSTLAFRLNVESELATTLFIEPLGYVGDVQSASESVDANIQALLGSADALGGTEENEQAVSALLAGEEAVADLARIRADSRALAIGPVAVTTFYTNFIETIVSAADDVAIAMNDRILVSTVQAYGDLDALVENIEYEYIVIERLIRSGDFLPGEASDARIMTARTDISLAEAQDAAEGISGAEEVPDFGASASDDAGNAGSFNSVRAQVLTGLDASLFTARTADWPSQVQEELAVYEPMREDMWERVETRAANNAQNALIGTIITTVAITLVVVLSLAIALIIARRIIGPLRRLTTTATAVRQELPRLVERVAIPGETVDVTEVQVPVESNDEVGRLAEAFNGVNAATLAIAGEQAALRGSISEMFVNVARRDQVLLNRQLSSIDEMERSEDDQETLTKLFALDHLATRMRRNSESLLVLAGIDTGRRLRRPMPLSDVVRTASSEIELYERVQLELDADPAMLGHSALTAAHLFAELLENATVFSDPGTSVVVRTVERGGDYVVEVEDSGIGMTEKELTAANSRVDSTAASEILGAQRLGLFVVGRIARRIGARVELRSQEGAGTLAIVTMPRALFAREDESAPQHVSSNAIDETTHAPSALVSHDEAQEISDTSRIPERSGARVSAYAPTAIQEGTSLSGRGGAGEPEPGSIDALIAADAANAPTAEQTNPEDLTSGAAESGLPTRRRRDAMSPADEQREKQSIVGLPARATDAQLSALEAEQAGGFTPSISPTEVAPQSLEQRSSMFRGFRSRRETEQEAATASPTSFGPELPKRGQPAPSSPQPDDTVQFEAVDAGPADEAPSAPAPEPTRTDEAPTTGAAPASGGFGASGAGGAAGAAGAAAFFSRRSREQQEQEVEAEQSAAPAFEPDFAFGSSEPAAEDSSTPGPVEEAADSEPAAPAPSEDDGLPVFRMPKLDVAPPRAATEQPAAAPAYEPGPAEQAAPAEEPARSDVPVFEHDDAFATDDVPASTQDDGPFVVPSLEDDEDEAPAPAFEQDAAPYGGVEHVSLVEDELPQATSPYDAPGVYDSGTPEAAAEDRPWHDQGAYDSSPAEGAAPGFMTDPAAPGYGAPESSDGTAEPEPSQAYEQQAATPVEGSAPAPQWGFQPESAPESSRSNPSLDALIQSAVDDETEQRPGFFSRLFGRGRGGESAGDSSAPGATGGMASQWAATTDAPRSAPSATPSAPSGGFVPASEPAPAPSSWQSAPETASAPESEPTGYGEAAPTSFAPNGDAEGSRAPSAPAWPQPDAHPGRQPVGAASAAEAPETSEPQRWETPPWEQPQPEAPEQPSYASPQGYQPAGGSEPEAGAWDSSQTSPAEEPPAASSASAFTPDQLAKPAGWEAAGASALQAAEPEGATTYQPVIQQDAGSDGGADLTSAVFSELSSLAAQRPKVEKTRAGLQRRRPSDAKPVEVHPIEDDASLAPAERDADAVRSRFSSFYSGTQRARDDVEAFDRQTEPAEASDT